MIKIKPSFVNTIFLRISHTFPGLRSKLKLAGMDEKPEEFVKKTFASAFYFTTGIFLLIFMVLAKLKLFKGVLIFIVPITFMVMFFYMIKLPDFRISKKEKEISKEIVFAGRFLIIELDSGVNLYNAMLNVSKNYKVIGKYFREMTNKIDLGTSMEDALNEAVELTPSNDFRKILWQVINSIRTGSDISKSLYSAVDQIMKDQMTEVNKYGKKLNPLAMFYLIIAVILPSLGITMLILLSYFLQFELSLSILLVLTAFLGFVQFLFISLVKFSRPAIEF